MATSPLLVKGAAIALVSVLVSGVLLRIEGLVQERTWRSVAAQSSVEQSLAGPQTLIGPLLERDCTEEWEETTGTGADRKTTTEHAAQKRVQVPGQLTVTGATTADLRYRGLFKVNTFAAKADAVARFPDQAGLQPARTHAGSRFTCGRPRVVLALDDMRGLRSATATVDGQALAIESGTGLDKYPHGWAAALPEARGADAAASQPLEVHVGLEFVGTARLAWVPAAGATEIALRSDWPHPSFGGQFLPVKRDVTDTGFSSRWVVSGLATDAPQQLGRGLAPCAPAAGASAAPSYGGDEEDAMPVHGPAASNCLDTLAVTFIDPVNPYVLSDRATKYGLLFITLTFLAVGLVEVLSGRRVHPMQYLLVGLALALFFLLLLSLSEHVAFAGAYAAASVACATLLGAYGAAIFGRATAGLAFGGAVAALYGLLYVLLQMEQNALVIGAVMMFVALATVMGLTRRIDWYALFAGWGRTGVAQQPAAESAR